MKTIFSYPWKFSVYAAVLLSVCAAFLFVDAQPALGANRALLVGVENYPNVKLRLQGVRDDVGLLKTALINTGLFANQEIQTLLDRKAQKANILQSFRHWLIDGTGKGDTVLFYFSGHGGRVWSEFDDKPDGMDSTLICWDTTSSRRPVRRRVRGKVGEAFDLKATRNMLLGRELNMLLKQLQGRRVIFVSDSCHSGTVYKELDPFFVQIKTIMDDSIEYKSVFEDRTSTPPLRTGARKAPMLVDQEIPGVEFVALTASEDSQAALIQEFTEAPTGKHSVFTWFLLHGLAGKAESRPDGTITFAKLAEFIEQGVKARTRSSQVPQTVFSPKELADEPVAPKRPAAARPTREHVSSDRVNRIDALWCLIESGRGVSRSETANLKAIVQRRVPVLKWTDQKDRASCRVVLEKVSGNYGARLSDSSGDYWETNRGPDLEAVASGLAGNLRAYFIQTAVMTLKNPSGRRQIDINISVKGPKRRSQGEAVNGDSIVFEADAKTGGYPYIFSVDTVGVIHPLYPLPNAEVRQLEPGNRGFLGTDNSFTVAEPFGKEAVFALMLDRPLSSLASVWAQDSIGDARHQSFDPQLRFLDTLWNELTASGKPKGDWTTRSWVVRSFRQ